MKISMYGKFVDDNDHFAFEDANDKYSLLTVELINKTDLFVKTNGFIAPQLFVKSINILSEYLDYNVDGFKDFDVDYQLIDINCGNIKIPFYNFKSKEEDNKYVLFVNGKPGELYYLLNDNMSLSDCVKNNQGVLSFGMKQGSNPYFMKNFINQKGFFREEYISGKYIKTHINDVDCLIEYNNKKENKNNIISSSAFDYPNFYTSQFLFKIVTVRELNPHEYEIDITDCDGRPKEKYVVSGESLYSVYYNYMVEKGYFESKEKHNVKQI